MKQISFVFATGSSWLDRLVTFVTRSSWSHVALRFEEEDVLVEALAGRGFLMESGNKYEGWTKSQTISCCIDDEVYSLMLAQSYRWKQESVDYGYATCLAIGIKELVGVRAGQAMVELLPRSSAKTMVCSEMLVKLWRHAAPDFLAGQDCRLVSPEQLYQGLLQQAGRGKN